MDKARPLSAEEITALMRPFALGEGSIAVAVSGGPDSMALAFCLVRFYGAQNVLALIVEHGLRAESAQEAAGVAARLRAMGIETEILPWVHNEVKSRIHVRAREARYALLIEACKKRGIKTLCLAHHAGDQAETILMRFAKGSGIDGLAGMEAVSELDGVRLVRPLLSVAKERLVATCEANGIQYVTDPSNEAEKYARGRLRRVMPLLEPEGLSAERLVDLGERAREAKEALDYYACAFLKQAAEILKGGAIRLDLAALRGLPRAVALRSVSLILSAIHKGDYPPERKMLLPFVAWLMDQDERETRTLHGCLAQKGDVCDKATFLRELSAITDCQPIATGETILWDGRWLVSISIHTSFRRRPESSATKTQTGLPVHWTPPFGGVTVEATGLECRPLGIQTRDVLDALSPRLRADIPQGRVRACLPALWRGQTLVAIPAFNKEDQGFATATLISPSWE